MLKLFLMTLVVVGVVAYLAVGRASSDAEITYITTPVEFGRLKEEVTASGTVDAMIKVDVSSQVSGRITEVGVDFNDSVTKGQPLAQIDLQSFEARVAEAKAAVKIALASVEVQKATLERAAVEIEAVKLERDVYRARIDQAAAGLSVLQSKFKRKETLEKSGTISIASIEEDRGAVLTGEAFLREAEALFAANEHRVEAAQSEFARAQAELIGVRANVPQRQAALQLAEVELSRTTIRAPIDGVIIDRSIDEGQTVAAALEAPTLFTIAEALGKMVVHVSVDETDIGRIRVGQTAIFTVDAFPDKIFAGAVSEIRKSAKNVQNIVTYTVVLRTENPNELLFPGMTALVIITISQSNQGLKIPTNALNYHPSVSIENDDPGNSSIVWQLDHAGNPQPLAVSISDQDASHTSVTSETLKAGDLIISSEIKRPRRGGFFGFAFEG